MLPINYALLDQTTQRVTAIRESWGSYTDMVIGLFICVIDIGCGIVEFIYNILGKIHAILVGIFELIRQLCTSVMDGVLGVVYGTHAQARRAWQVHPEGRRYTYHEAEVSASRGNEGRTERRSGACSLIESTSDFVSKNWQNAFVALICVVLLLLVAGNDNSEMDDYDLDDIDSMEEDTAGPTNTYTETPPARTIPKSVPSEPPPNTWKAPPPRPQQRTVYTKPKPIFQPMRLELGNGQLKRRASDECERSKREAVRIASLWSEGAQRLERGDPQCFDMFAEAILSQGYDDDVHLPSLASPDTVARLQAAVADKKEYSRRHRKHAHIILSYVMRTKQYMEVAIKHAKLAIKLQSSNGRLYQYKGGLHLRFQQYSEARAAFHTAHSTTPHSLGAMLGLGMAYVAHQGSQPEPFRAHMWFARFAERASICSRYMPGAAFTLARLEFEKAIKGRRLDTTSIKRALRDNPNVAKKAAEWYRQGLISIKSRNDNIDHYGREQKQKAARLMQTLASEEVDGLRSLPRDYFNGDSPWQYST